MNRVIAIIALVLLALVLTKGLAKAWMGIGIPAFMFIILAFVGIGWLWGKMSK